mmetsp:Transcript_46581/g.120581  ORF Transcript_46581/g.120581 Transcript_46581/m.120581 type:complete len:1065 (+) Transcript_46581:85-3279(+)
MADTLPGQVSDDKNQKTRPTGYMQNEKIGDNVRRWFNEQNGATLNGALAFVPFILQEAFFEDKLDTSQIVIHRGAGGVVFSDASGFTALTEKLAQKSNGAELLSQCLTMFFTPLIDLINAYRGDTIKFSGDALTIYFPSVDDTKCSAFNGIVPPHGSYGLPDLGPMATAVLRASACCIEIHKRLHMFDTGVDDVKLCLHIGVGCGEISILQVGGITPPETHVARTEYLISGAPLEQISIAEPLASNGETCLSPQAWELVKDCVIEGRQLEDRPDFHLLLRMDESKYTFPTIKYATQLYDTRAETQFRLSELNICRRYIPSSVFKQIEFGTLQYVNEMRTISVIFISGSGLDVMSEKGPQKAQELMQSVQRVCYAHEGTLNKFLIDDKGMLFLLVFGLPPLVHPDDPTRAVLASMEFAQVFERLGLIGRFGVTTGRSYCGVCGSAKRMEYTVLGDCVNLSARLMANAPPLGVLCDEETSKRATGEIVFKALPAIKVKGKAHPINTFQPTLKEQVECPGLTRERKLRFPWSNERSDDSPTEHREPGADPTAPKAFSKATITKQGVLLLCSLSRWPGIVKVMDMLGGTFNKAIHKPEQTIPTLSAPRTKAPAGSPFAEGGIVVLEGTTGLGKVELAEHIVTHCGTQFQMMPIFGTMGPRPGESRRMGVELLRSTVAVFRHLNDSTPSDDYQALEKIAPPHCGGYMEHIRELLHSKQAKGLADMHHELLIVESAVKVLIALLGVLKKQTPVLVVLQFEHGTSLFEKTMENDQNIFWKITADLTEFVSKEKQIAGMIIVREARHDNVAVQYAISQGSFLKLDGLSGDNIVEYLGKYLGVPDQNIPAELRKFVAQVTLGNALYIRETLDQLIQDATLVVKKGQSVSVTPGGLERTDIASWNHTAMVGSTVCLLESLDPIEAAALKMSTCFEGPFTLPDLAASSCSQWGGATRFDLLRLFRATQKLIRMNIIEACEAPQSSRMTGDRFDASPRSTDSPFGSTTYYCMKNLLVRTVGAAMVLEAQRKSVKRNALIDRVLKQDLPERMTALAAKKSVQHIPWYYERALRRMVC